jgi:hypothetical protein
MKINLKVLLKKLDERGVNYDFNGATNTLLISKKIQSIENNKSSYLNKHYILNFNIAGSHCLQIKAVHNRKIYKSNTTLSDFFYNIFNDYYEKTYIVSSK